MKYLISILSLLCLITMSGCACQKGSSGKYWLSNGSIVSCEHAMQMQCGVSLINCDDGRNYYCEVNVTEESK